VSVSFELREVPVADIPGVDRLKSIIQRCSVAEGNDTRKAKEFFSTAKKVLSGKSVSVLSITEQNTTGIRGPCQNGTPYFAYMKATGQSKKELKEGDTGLGSYGIGKFAPFAVSHLRTMFVSTVFEHSGKFAQYTQGKALLTSHVDSQQRTRQNIGYWGIRQRCMPVEGRYSELPKWIQRAHKASELPQHVGSSFHVIGFDAVQGWDKLLLASVLENFFGAIWRAKLSVKIGSELVAKETINQLFERPGWPEALKDLNGEPEAFNNARHFLSTLVGTEEVIIENQENRELGNCDVRIIVGEQLPKRVAVLRNGMFITDQMEHLKRFGDFKEFVAVVECQSKKGNELLREMEPPRHDQFEPDRLPAGDRARGQRALTELGRWVREMLKRHARDPVSDISEVKELADYFADDFGEEDSTSKGEEVNPVGPIMIRAQPLKRRLVVIRGEGLEEEGGSYDADGGGNGGGGNGEGGGEGGGRGGRGKSSGRAVDLSNVRSIILSERRRRVAFTPGFTGKLELSLYEAGADTDRRLTVIKCNAGKVKAGLVKNVPVKRGIRTTLEVDLDGPFLGAMKVAGYEI
jgi:hypothetical protein